MSIVDTFILTPIIYIMNFIMSIFYYFLNHKVATGVILFLIFIVYIKYEYSLFRVIKP